MISLRGDKVTAALTREVKLNHVSLSFDREGTQESSLDLREMEAQISNKRRDYHGKFCFSL